MLMTFLNVLFFLVCFLLVVVVLLQSGKGGGLAAGFGGSGTGFELLGGRQTASFLHRATSWLGGAFLTIAFAIALLTAHGNRPGLCAMSRARRAPCNRRVERRRICRAWWASPKARPRRRAKGRRRQPRPLPAPARFPPRRSPGVRGAAARPPRPGRREPRRPELRALDASAAPRLVAPELSAAAPILLPKWWNW